MGVINKNKPKPTATTPQQPSTPKKSNAMAVVGTMKNGFHNIIKKFKGFIIHAWIKDFEDQYLKTFKVVNTVHEPKDVVSMVQARMGDYDYTDRILIIVKYDPSERFSILATQTGLEKEYTEFQKWRKMHKDAK
jgi:hypothetical protein